jgi:hypothetical protein
VNFVGDALSVIWTAVASVATFAYLILGKEDTHRLLDRLDRPSRTVVSKGVMFSTLLLPRDERQRRQEEWQAIGWVLADRGKVGLWQAVKFVWASVRIRISTHGDPAMPADNPAVVGRAAPPDAVHPSGLLPHDQHHLGVVASEYQEHSSVEIDEAWLEYYAEVGLDSATGQHEVTEPEPHDVRWLGSPREPRRTYRPPRLGRPVPKPPLKGRRMPGPFDR